MTTINGQGRFGVRPPAINPLWDGLLAYYTGDNTSNDSKGTYNGALINGTTYGSGKINQGFSFDGINDYILAPNPVHNYSLPTTYNVWLKPNSLVNTKFFIYIPASNEGPAIGHVNGGYMTMFQGAVNGQVISSGKLDLNVWNMMTVVFKGNSFGTNNALFYKNGVYVDSKTITFYTANGFNPPYIGTSLRLGSSGAGLYYDGIEDEIGLWSRALTSSEVTELYNAGNGKQYIA